MRRLLGAERDGRRHARREPGRAAGRAVGAYQPRYAADARVLLAFTARESALRAPGFLGAVAALDAALERRFAFAAELRGIAALLGVDMPTLVTAQLWLELYGACSAAMVELDGADAGGGAAACGARAPAIVRTMDWNFEEPVFAADGSVEVASFQRVAERATFQAKFARGGRLLFVATRQAGAVGYITGLAAGRFGASVNFRLGEFRVPLDARRAESLARVVRGEAPVAFVVRELFERAGATFALAAARDALMSGCYVSLVGPRAGEGAVVTRAKTREAEDLPVWRLAADGPTVQTKDDIFEEDDGWARTGVEGGAKVFAPMEHPYYFFQREPTGAHPPSTSLAHATAAAAETHHPLLAPACARPQPRTRV